jgi:hypothetical protein
LDGRGVCRGTGDCGHSPCEPGTGRESSYGAARDGTLIISLVLAGIRRGALATLFGSRFLALARRGRDFELAFASAHLVHLGLVAWIYYASVILPAQSTLIFFGVGAFWTYLLAILSISHVTAKLNPRFWRIVRTVGVEYIALAFLVDFAKNPFQGGVVNLIAYLPFLILAVAGPLLRLAAVVKRQSQMGRLEV